MNEKSILEKIKKECFWDYNITPEELLAKIKSCDNREKSKIFAKIIENSTDRMAALHIFDKDDLKYLFDDYKNNFRYKQLESNILALRNFFLQEKNYIKRYEWKKR